MTKTQTRPNYYNQEQRLVRAEIVPAAHKTPSNITDPYTAGNTSPVQLVVKHEVTPESRAKAMAYKTHQVTVFLALLTGAAMYIMQLYPRHWAMWSIFLLWLVLASLEWLAAFVLLAMLDWRETPSAIEWRRTDGYLDLMKREQKARLIALYGLTVNEVKELDR